MIKVPQLNHEINLTNGTLIQGTIIQENMDQLTEKIKGMPALLFSKENPFTLYSILQKNKSPAPAKANQEAPKDIVVSAGPTTFAPGPIISELAEVGIKTKVDNNIKIINSIISEQADSDIIKISKSM
mgnify:CR=1 FL=1